MRALACLLAFAFLAAGQDAILPQILSHLHDSVGGIPNYTCVETVDRERQTATLNQFRRVDLVRLEVAKTGGRELFAWPGSGKFQEKPIAEFVGGGLSGDGSFDLFAENIFVNGLATMKFQGQGRLHGAPALRVDYFVRPTKEKRSRITLATASGSADVGYSGSFWVDQASYGLMQLDLNADNIPPRLQLSKARISVEYDAMTAGSRVVAMPRSSVIEFTYRGGEISRDDIEFARCREFAGRSSIVFEGQEGATADAASFGTEGVEPRKTFVLPQDLTIPLSLESEIDAGKAVIGEEVTAVVERDVRNAQRVWLPKGTVVRGRIRRLERRSGPTAREEDYVLVGLEFSEADVGPAKADFAAELVAVKESGRIQTEHTERDVSKTYDTPDPSVQGRFMIVRYREYFDRVIPGVGYLYITAKPYRIPVGFSMTWKTEALREGDR